MILEDVCERDSIRKLGMVMHRTESDVRKMLKIMIDAALISKNRMEELIVDLQEQEAAGIERLACSEDWDTLKIRKQDIDAALNKFKASSLEKTIAKQPRVNRIFIVAMAKILVKG